MYLGGIWIKGIVKIAIAVIAFLCGIYAHKKLKWKVQELSVTALICLGVMVFGLIDISHAIKPNIQQITVHYVSESKFGYHFIDENENNYDLTMDSITYGKLLDGAELDKDTLYTITYEEKSDTIIGIDTDNH